MINKMIGIVALPLVPLRQNDSDRSEMTSQLLFGEQVEILETRDKWLLVRNIADNYTGWVDRKMVQHINEEKNTDFYCINVAIVECYTKEKTETVLLPGGSKVNGNEIIIGGKSFIIDPINFKFSYDRSAERLISLAKQYLNTPYLWGGKSVMGIDCSGFVQVIYDMLGIQLPRDDYQQAECGKVIDFLTEAQTGDLAFFENTEGKIIHVGIILNSQQIIHASGWVKIESIDGQGIISNQTGEYTHKLQVLKRIIST